MIAAAQCAALSSGETCGPAADAGDRRAGVLVSTPTADYQQTKSLRNHGAAAREIRDKHQRKMRSERALRLDEFDARRRARLNFENRPCAQRLCVAF